MLIFNKENMADKKVKDPGKMLSVRTPQHDRLVKIAKAEHRSLRNLLERMMDKYEGKLK